MNDILSPHLNVQNGGLLQALSASDDFGKDQQFHSNIFNSEQTANSLLSAAAPIFTLAAKLKTAKAPAMEKVVFFDEVSGEIKAFMHKAQESGCRSNDVVIASYALCSLLDETISNTAWGPAFNWQEENLLKFFHQETSGAERFFNLLDQAYQEQALHIDLLELMYICLSLGFMGKYRSQNDGLATVSKINTLLYNCIVKQRGDLKKSFFISAARNQENDAANEQKPKKKGLIILLAGIFSAAAFIGFYFLKIMAAKAG